MIITLIIFLIVLSLLVFVHELGHFWTARRFGVRVDEFGFGIPPRICGIQKIGKKWKFTWGGRQITNEEPVIYSLNWIPIGGFVKIKGENGEDVAANDSFPSKPIGKRILIIAAGVIMNVVLCIVLLAIGYGFGMPGAVEGQSKYAKISNVQMQVVQVLKDSPAEKSGLKMGDELMSVGGIGIKSVDSLHDLLASKEGQSVRVDLVRAGQNISVDITPQKINDNVSLGIGLVQTGIIRYPWYIAIWQGVKTTFVWVWLIVAALFSILKNLIIHKPLGIELSGPIGIAVMTGQAAKLGWVYLLQFTALLSINLAIVNILPFPALDGGRILFLIVEKFRGRAMKQKWENMANNIGFLILLGLIIAVSFRDITVYGGRIVGAFKGLIGL
ncbi:MAG: RIP metalloprotease RseP [Candidatus Buchananbacteria bacterium]